MIDWEGRHYQLREAEADRGIPSCTCEQCCRFCEMGLLYERLVAAESSASRLRLEFKRREFPGLVARGDSRGG